MNSPKRKRRIRAFDIMLFGADTPETICMDTPGAHGPFREGPSMPRSLPRPGPEDKIVGYIEMDSETGVLTISEDGHTKTWYPDGRTEYKRE